MTDKVNKWKELDKRRVNIRFTEEELERLKKNAETFGENIQATIKMFCFRSNAERPCFDKDGTERVLTALSRIGNNMNQIARKLNTGLGEGSTLNLTEAIEELIAFKAFVGGFYGYN